MDEKFWDNGITGAKRADRFIKRIQGHLNLPANPALIIDGGSSIGLTTLDIHENFPSAKVIGVDLNIPRDQIPDDVKVKIDEGTIHLVIANYYKFIHHEKADIYFILNSLLLQIIDDQDLLNRKGEISSYLVNPILNLKDDGLLILGKNSIQNDSNEQNFSCIAIRRKGNRVLLEGDRRFYDENCDLSYETLQELVKVINLRLEDHSGSSPSNPNRT